MIEVGKVKGVAILVVVVIFVEVEGVWGLLFEVVGEIGEFTVVVDGVHMGKF